MKPKPGDVVISGGAHFVLIAPVVWVSGLWWVKNDIRVSMLRECDMEGVL